MHGRRSGRWAAPGLAAALGGAIRSAARVDRSRISPDVGLRCAVGIAIPLVVGRASGHTVAGVTAAIGALSGGFASHQGTYRSRAAVVAAATVAMAAAAFVGATVGHVLGPDILVTGLIGLAAGLMVSLGPGANVVGIQAVVGMVVFSQFSFSAAVAARDAGLVCVGGAVQALLVIAVWPLRRFPRERGALSVAFSELARYCRRVPDDPVALLDPAAFDGLEQVMRDPQPFGGDEAAAHQALAGQADRVRLEVVALARSRQRLTAVGAPQAGTFDELLAAAADVLEGVARALREARLPEGWDDSRDRFEAALDRLTGGDGSDAWPDLAVAEARRRGEALAGQLRNVVRTAAVPAGGDPRAVEEAAITGRPAAAGGSRRRMGEWAGERIGTLRSNLTMSSQAFRHALRMGVTLAGATWLSHLFSQDHRYWLPMTAMLVLRPDFSATLVRGLSRVAGTLFGAGLVTLVLAETRPSADWLIAAVVGLCFAAATLLLANYAIFSVCISSLVVTMLAFTGQPGVATAGDRSLYTVIGAALALLAYSLWPTWESASLPDTLAALAVTEAGYARSVLDAWADPARADRAGLQPARARARLARSNAEAAVTRWLGEPDRHGRLERDLVLGYMAAVRSLVQAVLALHAELPAGGPPHPEAGRLAEDVDRAMAAIAAAVDGHGSPGSLPRLRQEQLALTRSLGVGDGTVPGGPAAVALAGETDLLVNSVNTLGHLLGLTAG